MASQAAKKGGALDVIKWLAVAALLVAAILGNGQYPEVGLLYRVLGVLVLALVAVAIALTTDRGRKFNQYRKEAWTELRKVIWPTRTETTQTTLLVLAVVLLVALIMFLFDMLISFLIGLAVG
ncbi:preprotein translocase subunit SecE [Natronospirillum operosum]|uniref:Protein translocase subunit SecE n=1 Tax=Natronospirillum operosum TaxID=2759953 RepID=A0A4Z0W9L0_9GAMM|nr:preprotein translocase subunit SecE [Natronospirillum operosum]TGG90155.1 preprotein translocase subunit SecE [Natronospirillum operosum]